MQTVELARCGRVAIETCMGVKPDEQALIVADTLADPGVSEAMLGAARAAGAEAMLMIFPARPRGGMEPPPAVAAAMAQADAVFLHTTASLTHSQARMAAQQAGARVITMPGVSGDTFLRTMSANMTKLADLTQRLGALINKAQVARITSPLGTDLTLELGHPTLVADGLCHQRGELDTFPAGLALSVPREGGVHGRAVIDGSVTSIGRLAAPLTMIFEAGRAVQIEGGPEADRLAQLLAQFNDPAVYNFAAWGMGTNPGARLLGDEPSFEGERIYGWAHVSLGSNAALPGGTVRAPIHLDAIIAFPVVELDGRVVMSKGQFHLDE
ncbi:MAG: aminopeptidase [Chloroflexi bacterium]|nr:aminopeptidase [Chloroflexota bacterium]